MRNDVFCPSERHRNRAPSPVSGRLSAKPSRAITARILVIRCCRDLPLRGPFVTGASSPTIASISGSALLSFVVAHGGFPGRNGLGKGEPEREH